MENDNKKFNWTSILEAIKVLTPVVTMVLAILVYRTITKPDSEINKQRNAREQAKLLIDIFKEDDVFKLENGYDIFLATHKSIDTSINMVKIDSLVKYRINEREKAELVTEYTNLLVKKVEISRKYDSFDGIGEAAIGESRIAPDITFLQSFINQQLKQTEKKLLAHGVDLKEIRAYKEFHNLMKY